MTKTELEEKIRNGESVWFVLNEYSYEYDNVKKIDWTKVEGVELHNNYFQYFNGENLCGHYYKLVFKTKAEAEHYLNHANVTRTETLPFLTWEEFNKDTLGFDFTDNIGNKYRCHIVRDYRGGEDFIVLYDKNGTISVDEEWEATEENFYKAYDECVRLFRGEE